MDISGVNNSGAYSRSAQETQKAASTANNEVKTQATEKEDVGAEFIKSNGMSIGAYDKMDRKAILAEVKAMEEQRMNSFTQLLQGMLVKQGQKSNLTLPNMNLFVKPNQAADAAASIEKGGEYSVDAVAGRILDMAKSLAGGDTSKIDMLKNAVIKGFKQAEKAWGGKMPDITGDTYDAVMKGFDEWAGKTETDPKPEAKPEAKPETK